MGERKSRAKVRRLGKLTHRVGRKFVKVTGKATATNRKLIQTFLRKCNGPSRREHNGRENVSIRNEVSLHVFPNVAFRNAGLIELT